jgi:hypothetical protein
METVCRETGIPAWLVGGCVRDLLLARKPADIDLATPAPAELAARFGLLVGARPVPMDPARGIYRVPLGPRAFVDWCALRGPDLLTDLQGRDFTINALAIPLPLPPADPLLLDPWQGVADLQAGRLRMAGPTAFADDPLRLLRAFRFQAQYELAIDPPTYAALAAVVPALTRIAPERLLAEWWKLAGAPHVIRALAGVLDVGALSVLFPELPPAAAARGLSHVSALMTLVADPQASLGSVGSELYPLRDPARRARLHTGALLSGLAGPEVAIHARWDPIMGLGHRLRMSAADMRTLSLLLTGARALVALGAAPPLSPAQSLAFCDALGVQILDTLALGLVQEPALVAPARALLDFLRAHYWPALRHPLLTGRELLALGAPTGPWLGRLLDEVLRRQILGDLTTTEAAGTFAAAQIAAMKRQGG